MHDVSRRCFAVNSGTIKATPSATETDTVVTLTGTVTELEADADPANNAAEQEAHLRAFAPANVLTADLHTKITGPPARLPMIQRSL